MQLGYFYNQVVAFGKDRDPRPRAKISRFEDSMILYGEPSVQIKKLMVGIDIEVGELLLAERIRQQEGLDLVVSHHPEGRAYASLSEVMRLQVDLLKQAGVSPETARLLLEERMEEVRRRIIAQNHTRAVDAARLLNLPFMCAHTPADNHVFRFLESFLNKAKPKNLQGLLDLLITIPEYQIAAQNAAGPKIILGNPKRPVGKILFEMTGGTEGSKDAFDKLYKAGVRTLVSMHLSEEHFKKVKDANLNVVIAGHISSDTLGLNLLFDRIEETAGEKLEFINCSGFTRIRR